ncbi:hypothetical protein XA68_14323 [Ophiocordyceps unilateralis]|uniref:Uncharacterized protein n=1 Tax=Ophiocordyceps unilateralis TaxID=268505 RepID=A0A2A9PAF1_OPHUN|nr:hypothetical protein XA68_14323 [Ophiocordyceps unilateralis]
MASFARSFKPPPAYLSPYRRPTMPARTLSNSSEVSIASNTSGGDEAGEVVYSPVPESHPGRQDAVSPRPGNSRPIAIELPKIRKLNSTSVNTPPEPLSARGDLPGGYFPMHEDPKGRVHRPHPFHQDAAFARHQPLSHPDSLPMHLERKDGGGGGGALVAQASMPVASYLAPGFHDSPLPMARSPAADPFPVRQHGPQRANEGEAETRRKMQQYQRDMIAQAAMGLGGSAKTAGKPPGGATASLGGLPLKDVWLAVPSSLRPASPRLHPLGSPGPVTPMDLEPAAVGYLEHGAGKPHDWPVAEHRTTAGTAMASHSP